MTFFFRTENGPDGSKDCTEFSIKIKHRSLFRRPRLPLGFRGVLFSNLKKGPKTVNPQTHHIFISPDDISIFIANSDLNKPPHGTDGILNFRLYTRYALFSKVQRKMKKKAM